MALKDSRTAVSLAVQNNQAKSDIYLAYLAPLKEQKRTESKKIIELSPGVADKVIHVCYEAGSA